MPELLHSDAVRRLLEQIASMLDDLLKRDETTALDVQQLPLTQLELRELWESLGEGNVQALVRDQEEGTVQVVATGLYGLWRVTHYNVDEEQIGDFLEVGYCPEILVAATEDVRDGVQALRAHLFAGHYGKR